MSERWFSDEELREMSRPTMDCATEAIDRGDLEEAKSLCEREKHESQFMHDMLVDGMAGLISFVKERLGDEGVREAWEWSLERSWKQSVEKIDAADRKAIAQALAATWRGHSTGGVGPNPGRLRDRRGRREADLHDEPLRLGPAALAKWSLRTRTAGASPTRRTTGATGGRAFLSTAPTAPS